MRTSPDYLAAVSDLARDSESGSFPSFEIENCAADIGARYGVCDADVRDDVAEAVRRQIAAQPVSPRFFFTDATGQAREVYVPEHAFYCVCIGGTQIGESVDTPDATQALIDAHLADGVPLPLITVEAYRQGPRDETPVESLPFFRSGSWSDAYPIAA